MKSYLSLIPISAKVRKRQNRMTVLCIIISVFLVTAIFSVADISAEEKICEKMMQTIIPQTYAQVISPHLPRR